MPSITSKLWQTCTAFLGVALLATVVYTVVLRNENRKLTEWQTEMVEVVRDASGNDKVTKKTAKRQVREMGESLVTLSDALDRQNAAVEELARQRDEAKKRAEAEAKKRAEAIRRAQTLADELEAMGGEPVPDSDTAIRAMQDKAYEGGL